MTKQPLDVKNIIFKAYENKHPIIIQNVNLEVVFVNNKFVNELGLQQEDVIGKRLGELNHPIAEAAKQFNQRLQPLRDNPISGARYMVVFTSFKNTKVGIYTLSIRPVLSAASEFCGWFNEIREVNFCDLVDLNRIIMPAAQRSIVTEKPTEKITFTKREAEVIFLLILSKSPKEIAEIISEIDTTVTTSTVSAIISKQIYLKLNVDSTSDVVSKVLIHGLLDIKNSNIIRSLCNECYLLEEGCNPVILDTY